MVFIIIHLLIGMRDSIWNQITYIVKSLRENFQSSLNNGQSLKSVNPNEKFVILAADIIFRGEVLTILHVAAANIMHMEYPKIIRDHCEKLYDRLLKETPKGYGIIKDFKPSYTTVMTDPVVRNDTVYTPYMNVEIPKGRIKVEP